MNPEEVKPVWEYRNVDEENFFTTTFLELLEQYNYVWSPKIKDNLKINLGHEQKERFLHDFSKFINFDELQASVALLDIKEIYDEEYNRLLEASKKTDESKLPWFSLAHKLFRKSMIGEAREGGDISIQEFKRTELLSFYNHLIEADLLVISNRNLHLQAIHKEFLKFSSFITQPLNKKHFLVFLIPVFQHLYLLIRSHSGKSDADRFIRYYKYLYLPPDVINSLLQCETCEELQLLINSHARIRVKLSSNAYHILMNWLRDCFSESSEMFNILRVLHENFHVDIYHDKDDEDFSAVEAEVLQSIEKWMTDYEARKTQKKSKLKMSAETCKTPQSDDDLMAQKMTELEIEAETPKMPGTPLTSECNNDLVTQKMTELEIETETPKMPGTPLTSESNSSESNFEIKSSMFKLRDSARRYLEEVRQSGWDLDKIEQALLNPPDLVSSDTGKDDQEMDFLEDPGSMADENAGPSPLGHTVSVSPGDSEYVIWSDASTERNDEDDAQTRDGMDDQDLNDGNEEDSTEVQENIEPTDQDMNDASEDKHVVLFWYDEVYPVRVYAGHSMEAINCVRFHPNCSYFASASSDGNLFLFKINYDSCPVRMYRKHIAKVYTLAFSPCGKQLASADVEGMLIIWDILTYMPIKICETGQGIRSISYDISGSFIAALFYYKSWKVYNIEEDSINAVIEAESVGVPKSVHFSTDNKMLIIQYIEADKSEIAETKEKPKTKITMVNYL
ncbi:hypothetical protein AVEN_270414-3 [Araneus ventricosus]|uniref:Uncharacterized protein n=1 Tax=Araneus ventricosus TaxID=182803 RepID=A0A4Y2HPU8_ARAVE|nr:hypothetical protein AVEN_270414-3 [Araneus ventricosus]